MGRKRIKKKREAKGHAGDGRSFRLAVTLLKILLAFVLTFSALEITLRVYNALNPTFLFDPGDEINRFRGKPYSNVYGYRLNSGGFKDREYPVEKPPGAFRVLGLGDSFLYALVPYPDNFFTLLEERLSGDGLPVEMINMGVNGIGPYEYRMYLQNEGLRLDPDMVIVFFYVGNDILMVADNDMIPEQGVSRGFNSYALQFMRALLRIAGSVNPSVLMGDEYNDTAPTFKNEKYRRLVTMNAFKHVLDDEGGMAAWEIPQWKESFGLQMGNMFQIKKMCDDNGIRLLTVLIPEELQVNRELQTMVEGLNPGVRYDYGILNAQLAEVFGKMGIETLDLLPYFVREYGLKGGKRYFKPNDTHWNLESNRFAAGVLYDYLSTRQYIKSLR